MLFSFLLIAIAVAALVQGMKMQAQVAPDLSPDQAQVRDMVYAYAAIHLYSVLPAVMSSGFGQDRLFRFLPPGLKKIEGKPLIPFYTLAEEARAAYRTAYILRRIRHGREMRLFVLPLYKHASRGNIGVAYVTGMVPSTRHWLKLYREAWPMESRSDHDVESNIFNRKYVLTGSEPKMLTEVFDPLLIERFNTKPDTTFMARVRSGVVEFAERGALSPALFDEGTQLFDALETRFLKAYTSYPEPK
ncbi:MAG: hypothetical protein Q8O51_02405 [bacterium]|nr:hypothetical protein [bacterium]